MGAYLSQASTVDQQRIQHLEKQLNLLERRIYISEQNSKFVNETLVDLETRIDSTEKTIDYINTSITYIQHTMSEISDEVFHTK